MYLCTSLGMLICAYMQLYTCIYIYIYRCIFCLDLGLVLYQYIKPQVYIPYNKHYKRDLNMHIPCMKHCKRPSDY